MVTHAVIDIGWMATKPMLMEAPAQQLIAADPKDRPRPTRTFTLLINDYYN